jgi:hypothetical protein
VLECANFVCTSFGFQNLPTKKLVKTKMVFVLKVTREQLAEKRRDVVVFRVRAPPARPSAGQTACCSAMACLRVHPRAAFLPILIELAG